MEIAVTQMADGIFTGPFPEEKDEKSEGDGFLLYHPLLLNNDCVLKSLF